MGRPYFSVIVPAHNSEEYIRRGLNSIRRQSFRDYELIIVCDNCTDGTKHIALGYADKMIVTHYGMDGLARNAGLDAAEGEWVLFMDDDDWFLHEFVFEQLHEELEREKAMGRKIDMLLFSFIWKNRGYERQRPSAMRIAVWCKCWRREFIGDTRFPAIPFTSDDPFMQEIIRKDPAITTWDMPMYYYNYMRKGSQTERHARPDGAVPEA